MKLLDLFCGEGGAARGYMAAGFDVTGIDMKKSVGRHYPGTFIHGDWREETDRLRERGYRPDLVHASPPCQLYSITNASRQAQYPDLVGPVREYLLDWGIPFVIENVERAPLVNPVTYCGTMFGLMADDPASGKTLFLRRHRLFEAHGFKPISGWCLCNEWKTRGLVVGGVYGGGRTNLDEARNVRHGGYTPPSKAVRARLMGIDERHMTLKGMSEAIPPVYSTFIGVWFMAVSANAA